MAMATDPFDPHIASFEKVATVRREVPSLPAHLPPLALIIPTFFGPMAVAAPDDCPCAEAPSR
jgi:hypothetical protein